MNNLLSVLLSTLKARITPLWTKLKYWTSWSFIKANILTKIRMALNTVFQVKPRHKKDYYPFFGYLISQRLARAIVIVVGILCLCYFIWINPVANIKEGMESGTKTYSYHSIPLRFAKGNVKIKAKAGYIAYEGNVEDGYATGSGKLFDENEALLYEGNFEKNEYSGTGTLYYPIGQVKYTGEFQHNAFEGEGKLYRENGTKQYAGQFSKGVFEGEGSLYNTADTEVFKGSFHNGELAYTQLLGKSAAEIAEYYTGSSLIYQDETDWAVIMEDIDAFYVAPSESSSLEDDIKATAIYVGKNEFAYGDYKASTIDELRSILGTPVFEGNSYVTFPEAVGINWLQKNGRDIPIEVSVEASHPFDEVWELESYQRDVLVYLYVFQAEDVTYTFIAADKDSRFFMYALE